MNLIFPYVPYELDRVLSPSSSFICLKEQKHIQTNRSTKAKYALTGVLMKDHS